MTNQASRCINDMPIGERDCEDGGNQKAPLTFDVTLRTHEAWLKKTAARRNQLRVAAETEFRQVNHRDVPKGGWERDLMLKKINNQIVAEFGPEPKVRM